VQVRLGDLDVVAEHPVVADFQRSNAGPDPFALLHLGDDLFAGSTDRPEIVELAIDAVPREAAVPRQHRRVGRSSVDSMVSRTSGRSSSSADQRLHEGSLSSDEHRS
jgi:hypothetical protein